MSHVLRIGVVDQIALFRAYNTDGSGKADLTSATAGLTLSVFRTGLASVSIASLSNKAADNTTHADGAIRSVGGNLYTVDLPDAATANQCPSIGVVGSYTGGVIEPVPHPIVNYDPSLVAVGANTEASKAFTFGSGPTIQIADTAKRQITWPTASETITGTIQWDGQVSKAITGAITFRETISGNHFYDWAYNAADRPPVPGYAVIQFTDGVFTDDPLVVGFVSAPTVSAFEARTLPSADYFVEGDYTEPPTVNQIQSGLSTLTAQQVWDYVITGSTSAATAVTTLISRIIGTLAAGTHEPNSGDSFTRLGAPDGESIAADIAAIDGGGGSGLTGPWTRTITVTDSVSGDPIQNATVRFFRTGETETKATDVSGVASFTVEAATWSYAIVASGYAGTSGTVEVDASGNTAVGMVLTPIDEPEDPSLIPVLVNLFTQFGEPCVAAKVVVEVIGDPAIASLAALTNVDNISHTGNNGQARINLYRGQLYRFTITYKRHTPIVLLRTLPAAGDSFVVTQVVS